MNENPTTAEEQYELGKKYIGHEYIAGITIEERNEKGINLLAKAAEQGHAEAQYKLHSLYKQGDKELNVQQDQDKSVVWLTKAAEQDHAEAQFYLALEYRSKKDMKKADYWFTKAIKLLSEQGKAKTMNEFRKRYSLYDIDLTKAAEQGDAEAQYDLACQYYYKDLKTNSNYWFTQAIESLTQAAKQGDAEAMYKLSDIFERAVHGMGVRNIPQADIKARDFLFEAAKHGHIEAQYKIGDAYQNDCGALHLVMAAEQGHAEAQYRLGGNHWLTKAAEQDHTEAQYKIGYNYIRGIGVEKDLDRGAYWLTKAAKKDHYKAQIELVRLYENDKEKQQYWKDRAKESKKWFSKLWKPIIEKFC